MEKIKRKKYIPDAGDIVWLHFDPQAGHEQAGHRPALVLSSSVYNSRTNLMLCCPITSQIKGYPFEVLLSDDKKSAVLADQVKSLDWSVRNAVLKGKATKSELSEVRKKAAILIGNP
ncbi:Endoribonuclease toxin MazF [Commensalibacter sp. Nvir]|uniref:endoribonuclease MazF n=1 Tax=Commensalibacter sp. Nvir TaxID=3069817 RepID=UPI002D2909CB|nr:Endoribonuclease toxin MazF [Commensalibacter sp. Nvir]